MSQQQNVTCPECKNPWLTHHNFMGFLDDGAPDLECSPNPVAPNPVLKYVLAVNGEMERLNGTIQGLEKDLKDADETRQRDAAELIRRHESDIGARVAAKTAAAQADLEKTKIAMQGYSGRVLDLEAQLKEALGTSEILRTAKADLERKLAESQAVALERDLEIGELKADLGRLTKLKEDILKLVTDDEDAPAVPATPTAPVPAATAPAPKPVMAPTPAPQPTPAPTPNRVRFPGPALPAFSAPASAVDDDEGGDDDDDHDVDDADIDGEEDAETSHACTRTGCKHLPTKVLHYFSKAGAKEKILSCGMDEHDQLFFEHLKRDARIPPASVADMQKKFNPFQGGTP